MANIITPHTEEEVKKMPVAKLRQEYLRMAEDYNKMINGDLVFCGHCGKWLPKSSYYSKKSNDSGIEPFACKKCLLNMATDKAGKAELRVDNKEKAISVLQRLDLPFIEKVYDTAVQDCASDVGEKNRSVGWLQYMVMILSLPNWRGQTFANSEWEIPAEDDANDGLTSEAALKKARKLFGNYPDKDLAFLYTEYKDWTQRYVCDSKAQELLFKRVCFKQLAIENAQKAGKDTKELDKSLQELISSLGLKPSQNNNNALADNLTFGQLIDKWENEQPIPEPSEEFKDVDKIGLYIDVFFKGHLSMMMDIKNAFSRLYDAFMAKYTVTKPEYEADTDSEVMFDRIFGKKMDEE